MPVSPDRIALTLPELAERLGISEPTLRRRLADGSIPVKPRRLGRKSLFPVKAVEAWLAEPTTSARAS